MVPPTRTGRLILEKMYQTKRLESDMTQESLLQQCTLDSRAKVNERDENVRE